MTDLRNYISLIKKSGDLKTIKTPVSTKYEIAGITAKFDGSFAVMFENIRESEFNLVANLVGTRKRFAQAIGSNETKIHERVISAIKKMAVKGACKTPAIKPVIPNNVKLDSDT